MKLFKRMVSLTLMSAILVGFSAGINADAGLRIDSVFTDKVLRKIVKTKFDTNGDGYLNSTEISKAKKIDLEGGVADIEGLQYLTNCKTAYFFDVDMGVINLGKYTNIETCYVLEASNVKTFIGGKGLKELYINGSGITSMSLERSPELKDFTFIYNKTYYGDLNLARNRKLKYIRIESVEKLDYIVFPQNAEVTKICCSNLPRVCSVDISTTVKLSSLQCVYFENMDVGSYRLSGEMFMLMCRRTEYSANGQYIKLR